MNQQLSVETRIEILIARCRHRQLSLARLGRVTESARYAQRAHRLEKAIGWAHSSREMIAC